MNNFLEGFLDGFTGAGMFLGSRPVERAPLCAPESLIETDEELVSALNRIFTLEENSAMDRHTQRIAAETRQMILDASLAMRNASSVKSGS